MKRFALLSCIALCALSGCAKKDFAVCYNTLDMFIEFQFQYPTLPATLYRTVVKHCDGTQIRPEWIVSLIFEESRFFHRAVSRKGAAGLCQLMPDTQRRYNVDDPFNAEQNIKAGIKFFEYCLKRSGGDLYSAYLRYNAGPNRITYPKESRVYASRCMTNVIASSQFIYR